MKNLISSGRLFLFFNFFWILTILSGCFQSTPDSKVVDVKNYHVPNDCTMPNDQVLSPQGFKAVLKCIDKDDDLQLQQFLEKLSDQTVNFLFLSVLNEEILKKPARLYELIETFKATKDQKILNESMQYLFSFLEKNIDFFLELLDVLKKDLENNDRKELRENLFHKNFNLVLNNKLNHILNSIKENKFNSNLILDISSELFRLEKDLDNKNILDCFLSPFKRSATDEDWRKIQESLKLFLSSDDQFLTKTLKYLYQGYKINNVHPVLNILESFINSPSRHVDEKKIVIELADLSEEIRRLIKQLSKLAQNGKLVKTIEDLTQFYVTYAEKHASKIKTYPFSSLENDMTYQFLSLFPFNIEKWTYDFFEFGTENFTLSKNKIIFNLDSAIQFGTQLFFNKNKRTDFLSLKAMITTLISTFEKWNNDGSLLTLFKDLKEISKFDLPEQTTNFKFDPKNIHECDERRLNELVALKEGVPYGEVPSRVKELYEEVFNAVRVNHLQIPGLGSSPQDPSYDWKNKKLQTSWALNHDQDSIENDSNNLRNALDPLIKQIVDADLLKKNSHWILNPLFHFFNSFTQDLVDPTFAQRNSYKIHFPSTHFLKWHWDRSSNMPFYIIPEDELKEDTNIARLVLLNPLDELTMVMTNLDFKAPTKSFVGISVNPSFNSLREYGLAFGDLNNFQQLPFVNQKTSLDVSEESKNKANAAKHSISFPYAPNYYRFQGSESYSEPIQELFPYDKKDPWHYHTIVNASVSMLSNSMSAVKSLYRSLSGHTPDPSPAPQRKQIAIRKSDKSVTRSQSNIVTEEERIERLSMNANRSDDRRTYSSPKAHDHSTNYRNVFNLFQLQPVLSKNSHGYEGQTSFSGGMDVLRDAFYYFYTLSGNHAKPKADGGHLTQLNGDWHTENYLNVILTVGKMNILGLTGKFINHYKYSENLNDAIFPPLVDMFQGIVQLHTKSYPGPHSEVLFSEKFYLEDFLRAFFHVEDERLTTEEKVELFWSKFQPIYDFYKKDSIQEKDWKGLRDISLYSLALLNRLEKVSPGTMELFLKAATQLLKMQSTQPFTDLKKSVDLSFSSSSGDESEEIMEKENQSTPSLSFFLLSKFPDMSQFLEKAYFYQREPSFENFNENEDSSRILVNISKLMKDFSDQLSIELKKEMNPSGFHF